MTGANSPMPNSTRPAGRQAESDTHCYCIALPCPLPPTGQFGGQHVGLGAVTRAQVGDDGGAVGGGGVGELAGDFVALGVAQQAGLVDAHFALQGDALLGGVASQRRVIGGRGGRAAAKAAATAPPSPRRPPRRDQIRITG